MRRRPLVITVIVLGAVVVTVIGVLAVQGARSHAQDAAYAPQQRIDRPLRELTLPRVRLPGAWREESHRYVDDTARDGAAQSVARSWTSSGNAELEQLVYCYPTPAEAAEVYRTADPDQVRRAQLDLPDAPPAPVLRPTRKIAQRADESRVQCDENHGPPGSPAEHSCRGFWVWLRYGQYLVELHVDAVGIDPRDPLFPGPVPRIPGWLYPLVHDAERTLAERAPRR